SKSRKAPISSRSTKRGRIHWWAAVSRRRSSSPRRRWRPPCARRRAWGNVWPGTLYAAQAGVVSIDHAFQLSDATMKLMHEKRIFAVPTFTIFEYFADHAANPAEGVLNR